MRVYLDESGDSGWTFDKPYRNGGSSRFLCLAFLFIPKPLCKESQGVITKMYHRYRWTSEKKASSASVSQKLEFVEAVKTLLAGNPQIKIDCIVAKKENVKPHIRADGNKLYNYMCGLVIPDHVRQVSEFEFVPDKRSIKVESGNSLSDYLQTKLWFDHEIPARLRNNPQESASNYNLQFVDWIANCVWSHFEDAETSVYGQLRPIIRVRQLFFNTV